MMGPIGIIGCIAAAAAVAAVDEAGGEDRHLLQDPRRLKSMLGKVGDVFMWLWDKPSSRCSTGSQDRPGRSGETSGPVHRGQGRFDKVGEAFQWLWDKVSDLLNWLKNNWPTDRWPSSPGRSGSPSGDHRQELGQDPRVHQGRARQDQEVPQEDVGRRHRQAAVMPGTGWSRKSRPDQPLALPDDLRRSGRSCAKLLGRRQDEARAKSGTGWIRKLVIASASGSTDRPAGLQQPSWRSSGTSSRTSSSDAWDWVQRQVGRHQDRGREVARPDRQSKLKNIWNGMGEGLISRDQLGRRARSTG